MAVPVPNLVRALDSLGLTDQQIAELFGTSKQAVGGWRTTGRISQEKVELLSEKSGIPISEITGRPTRGVVIPAYEIKTDEDDPEDGDEFVDVIDIELAAGAGVTAPEFVETVYRHTYRSEFLRAMGVKPQNVRRCRVTGDSMERVLFAGDVVSIDISARKVEDDGVYAILVADQLKIKTLRRRRDGGLQIISENAARHPMEEVEPEDLGSVYIIGRAFDKSGRGGLGWPR